ncbi:hypothetical protein LINPERPRIM_LOCUS22680 [Linum perenne]
MLLTTTLMRLRLSRRLSSSSEIGRCRLYMFTERVIMQQIILLM